jgi:hypothetical protein
MAWCKIWLDQRLNSLDIDPRHFVFSLLFIEISTRFRGRKHWTDWEEILSVLKIYRAFMSFPTINWVFISIHRDLHVRPLSWTFTKCWSIALLLPECGGSLSNMSENETNVFFPETEADCHSRSYSRARKWSG